MKKVLLAENEISLARSVTQLLVNKGMHVTPVKTLKGAMQYIEDGEFDLLIIDRMLDDGDGLDLIQYANQERFSTRVLCLTQLNQVADRVKGLGSGADDYLGKPFSGEELLLRISSLLAKQKLTDSRIIEVGPLKLYPDTGDLLIRQRHVVLRKRECQILSCLLRYRNRVVSRDTLINQIWQGELEIPTYTTLDVYIRRIRVMLGRYRTMIKTVRGFGYMFKA